VRLWWWLAAGDNDKHFRRCRASITQLAISLRCWKTKESSVFSDKAAVRNL
jgi:hypothetical protein